MQSYLLSALTFIPLAGAALILVMLAVQKALGLGKSAVENGARVIALVASAINLVLGLWLWAKFDANAAGPQFVDHFVWIRQFNIEYFLGVDGISVSMVILTVIISFVATIASMPWWGFKEDTSHGHGDGHGAHDTGTAQPHFSVNKVPGYMSMLLILQTGMIGTFTALDMFLFYVFWEVMLLPMYFLIGIWGGPRKEYAAIKFFLYTLAGSVLMLLAIIAVYYGTDTRTLPFTLVDGTRVPHTFNMLQLMAVGQSGGWAHLAPILGMKFATAVWIGFFVAFAVKVPMVPLHTWLPDAHVEAPTPISVILAGVLLKMGGYGILRVNVQILPDATRELAGWLAAFGAINIVYAAFVCLAQKDLKKLIAYSSVSHMGFCLLGIAAFTPQSISGAVFNMWTHGLISPMLFLIVGVIYDRAHHREIERFGGLAKAVPEYTFAMGLAFFASLGLPGLCGFVSEFLVLSGSFPTYRALTILSATSVIITAAYYLWTLQRMFLGKLNPAYAHLPDLSWRERLTLYPLGVLVVVFGVYPNLMLDLINPSLAKMAAMLTKLS